MKHVKVSIKQREPQVEDQLPSHFSPLIKTVLRNRSIGTQDQLNASLKCLIPPDQLAGMDKAIGLIQTAMQQGQHILIVGDFDADGATSTALTIKALRLMGHDNVSYLVPNRFEFGYGLSPDIVDLASERNPDLLITVDNGISSIEGVAKAKALGMRVVVTDHHLPGSQQPMADAIVNPNNIGDSFPSKNLAGVGVIFYTMMALRAALRETGWFNDRPEPNLASLLDLVALGTVADVVPLDQNNRILVQQGLSRLRGGHGCPGIRALAEISGCDVSRLLSKDLGYFIGPRLNAAGRLEDMSIGIECLLADDDNDARHLASLLHQINDERKAVEADMQAQALDLIQSIAPDEEQRGIVLFDAQWHQGVIGLVASRIKERYHRPTVVFAEGEQGELKGSARSIEGFHIRDAFDEIASLRPDIMKKFGGHAMAAGLTLMPEHLPTFQQMFDDVARKHLSGPTVEKTLWIDAMIAEGELDLANTRAIEQLLPWGQQLPQPTFSAVVEIVERRVLKEKHLKIRLRLGTQMVDGIAFNCAESSWFDLQGRVNVVFQTGVNAFRDNETMQWVVAHMEPA